MCLLFFAIDIHPRYPLIMLANRDEYYDRPSLAAAPWEDAPDVLGGRDCVSSGSWMALTRHGQLMALTNYRTPHQIKQAPSRGKLVTEFLVHNTPPEQAIHSSNLQFNPFNCIYGKLTPNIHLNFYSSLKVETKTLTRGIYGISNAFLDTPWPKVKKGKNKFTSIVLKNIFSINELLDIMVDTQQAKSEDLPDTGVGLEWERVLSSIFIQSPTYGTRCTTLLLLDAQHNVTFVERTYEQCPTKYSDKRYTFDLTN